MKNKLIIIGASGHGKVVADIAIKMGKWNSISFLDDDNSLSSSMDIDVIGPSDDYVKYLKECDFFVAIGNNTIRRRLLNKLELDGAKIPVLIHPNAILGEKVDLGLGSVIIAGAVINCCTRIGKGCIINTGATVDHDNIIGDYVHISPGVHTAGSVHVGEMSWLGIGSIISNNVAITDNCVIGAGAVVIHNINQPGTYVGIPARRR